MGSPVIGFTGGGGSVLGAGAGPPGRVLIFAHVAGSTPKRFIAQPGGPGPPAPIAAATPPASGGAGTGTQAKQTAVKRPATKRRKRPGIDSSPGNIMFELGTAQPTV
jgi:hypothetical protein